MNVQTTVPPAALVGSVHRFGPHGVLYQVIRILDDQRALIRILDTGEETPYALTKILADPTS
jgi:hypothetical protein